MCSSSYHLSLPNLLSPTTGLIGPTCGPDALCPAGSPCCNELGHCGNGSVYCRGGCNALWSYSLSSCDPDPICQSASYDFTAASASLLILSNVTNFDNDPAEYAFTLDTGNIVWSADDGLALALSEANGGTRLSTTRYIDYGTITVRLKTGRWAGVALAFMTMSDVKDEIHWAFVGAATTQAHTQDAWLGGMNSTNLTVGTISGLSDTYENFHDFTIDWQPYAINWLVDGSLVRTVYKNSTWTTDSLGSRYEYPSTPSRVQLYIWPAGSPSAAFETIQWSGGSVDWSDPDYLANNDSFLAYVQSINITCSSYTEVAQGAQSYIFTGNDSSGVPQYSVSIESPLTDTTAASSGVGAGTGRDVGIWVIIRVTAFITGLIGWMSL